MLLPSVYCSVPYSIPYKLTGRQGEPEEKTGQRKNRREAPATSADQKSHDRRSHEPFPARNRKSGLRRKLLGPDGREAKAHLVPELQTPSCPVWPLLATMDSAARFKRSASLTADRASRGTSLRSLYFPHGQDPSRGLDAGGSRAMTFLISTKGRASWTLDSSRNPFGKPDSINDAPYYQSHGRHRYIP